MEVGHRRFFVKLWIRLLDQQRIGKQRTLTTDEVHALVRDEQALQVEEFDLGGRLRQAVDHAGEGGAAGDVARRVDRVRDLEVVDQLVAVGADRSHGLVVRVVRLFGEHFVDLSKEGTKKMAFKARKLSSGLFEVVGLEAFIEQKISQWGKKIGAKTARGRSIE